jgi:hypothetical protein
LDAQADSIANKIESAIRKSKWRVRYAGEIRGFIVGVISSFVVWLLTVGFTGLVRK